MRIYRYRWQFYFKKYRWLKIFECMIDLNYTWEKIKNISLTILGIDIFKLQIAKDTNKNENKGYCIVGMICLMNFCYNFLIALSKEKTFSEYFFKNE